MTDSDTPQPAPFTVPEIDWRRFFKKLDDLTVSIPEPAPGEEIAPIELSRLFIRVQRNRDQVDTATRKLLMRVGNLKKRLSRLEYELRVEKATLLEDPLFTDHRSNGSKRNARLDALCGLTLHKLGMLKGAIGQHETALAASNMTLKTLDRAKETLNAVQRNSQAGSVLSGGSYTTGYGHSGASR